MDKTVYVLYLEQEFHKKEGVLPAALGGDPVRCWLACVAVSVVMRKLLGIASGGQFAIVESWAWNLVYGAMLLLVFVLV